ncbi:MAG: hypothetical protein PHS57_10790 [Alphaproteobacteria bacterium]|nr:hypothetical protein [Alphaproteobacteria bacterium]
MDYVKIKFKGGWALLARGEFDAKKHELYTEPVPVTEEAEPPEEVKLDEPRSGGRKRQIKR